MFKKSINKTSLESILEELSAPQSISDFQYYSALKKRELILDEQVDETILRNVVLPLKAMINDGTGEKITLSIQSPGGSVWDALYLCNIIEKTTTPIDIIVHGYAMSMGIIIAMAGKHNPLVNRKCYAFSIGLLHSGSISVSTDTKKAKELMAFNDKIEEKVRTYILENTNLTEETYEDRKDEEWYMLAEDMLEHGIVDEII